MLFYLFFELTCQFTWRSQEEESGEVGELEMKNMTGIFLVLLIGTILAFLYGCIEFVFNVYRESNDVKVQADASQLSISSLDNGYMLRL